MHVRACMCVCGFFFGGQSLCVQLLCYVALACYSTVVSRTGKVVVWSEMHLHR